MIDPAPTETPTPLPDPRPDGTGSGTGVHEKSRIGAGAGSQKNFEIGVEAGQGYQKICESGRGRIGVPKKFRNRGRAHHLKGCVSATNNAKK